jgi:hypothetical protein
VIQNEYEQATSASDAGFRLTEQLYQDIMHRNHSISGIACDQLVEVVKWCLSHNFEVGGTTWPACENWISARRDHPIHTPGEQSHWLCARGLWLVYDLTFELHLDNDWRLRLREFHARALRLISDLCYHAEVEAMLNNGPLSSRCQWWSEPGDEILDRLISYRNSADPSISDAALDAEQDKNIRQEFRDFQLALRLG